MRSFAVEYYFYSEEGGNLIEMERDAEIVALLLGASFGSFSMAWPRNGQFGLGWERQCQRVYFGTKEL